MEQELEVLAKRFDKIVVVPLTDEGTDTCRELPPNAALDRLFLDCTYRVNKKYLLRHLPLVLGILWLELRKTRNTYIFKDIKILVETLLIMLELGDRFAARHLTKPAVVRNARFHAAWMYDNALTLALLKARGKINHFQFRVHGYDLYEARRKGNYLPFRHFNMKHVTKVITISKLGFNYLRARGIPASKLRTCYLGVNDHGIGPFDENAPFTLVSVSNLIPLKRIHRILETLATLDFPVRFIQFGKGPLHEELETLAANLPAHIRCEFMGEIQNAALMDWYKQHTVHGHLLVSETEGLPMAPVEAMSFGIPVIVTDVGGVSELVNAQNGVLLPADFTNAQLAQAIKKLRSELATAEFRGQVRNWFLEHFNAATNYQRFADELLSD